MPLAYSSKLKSDLWSSVQSAMTVAGIVNVPLVAEQVRGRNEIENIALEDMEGLVLEAAQFFGAAVEFDSLAVYERACPLTVREIMAPAPSAGAAPCRHKDAHRRPPRRARRRGRAPWTG